jgi:hypothetical protein
MPILLVVVAEFKVSSFKFQVFSPNGTLLSVSAQTLSAVDEPETRNLKLETDRAFCLFSFALLCSGHLED